MIEPFRCSRAGVATARCPSLMRALHCFALLP
jgi:hypothetical protein